MPGVVITLELKYVQLSLDTAMGYQTKWNNDRLTEKKPPIILFLTLSDMKVKFSV